jgi:RNA recognition motif-containing protein
MSTRTHLPSQPDSSVAVYLSGLPEDGSVPEETMQALFGSYGSFRKIHLHRNKKTGELKGDALVIYQIEQLLVDVVTRKTQ